MLSAGNYGCYLFCLIDVAEEATKTKIDKLNAIEESIKKGYVYFDTSNYNNSDNFYVKNPDKILEMLTGFKWSVTKEDARYKKKSNDYIIEQWIYQNRGGHFARINKGFNSLQCSLNVEKGVIASYRVCRVIG